MNKNSSKPTILAVDDTPTSIDVIKSTLSESYIVQAAISGQMALKIIEKKKPDLILLDIMMPEMNGYELCRRIKNNENLKSIPVIFLTVKSEIDDLLQGFELGAVDYVCKPFNPLELLARIKLHLELAWARDEIKTLRGILPICGYCKNIRNDEGYYEQIESYIHKHSGVGFSHTICPTCVKEHHPDMYEKLVLKKNNITLSCSLRKIC